MISTPRLLLVVVNILNCKGQLSITSGPIIQGRSGTLLCSIPNFSAAGQWIRDDLQLAATECTSISFCTIVSEGTKYRYSSNTTGISAIINTVDRSEQKVWTCSHSGYTPITFSIRYESNVFVTPSTVDVRGIDENVTLGDSTNEIALNFTTLCMHPRPEIKLYYKDAGENITIVTNLTFLSTISNTCLPPEARYTGGITVTSDVLPCGTTILPRLLVTPEKLPFEYLTSEWTSSYHVTFPACKDIGQTTTTISTNTSTTTTRTTTASTSSEFVNTTLPGDNLVIGENKSSAEHVEMYVGISVGSVILLIVVLYVVVVFVKRQKQHGHFDNFSNFGTNTQSLVPEIMSVEQITNDYDIEFGSKKHVGLNSRNDKMEANYQNNSRNNTESRQMQSDHQEVILSVDALVASADDTTFKTESTVQLGQTQNNESDKRSDSGDEILFVVNM